MLTGSIYTLRRGLEGYLGEVERRSDQTTIQGEEVVGGEIDGEGYEGVGDHRSDIEWVEGVQMTLDTYIDGRAGASLNVERMGTTPSTPVV
jgi:hypothetical protein